MKDIVTPPEAKEKLLKCSECGTRMEKNEEESSEYHEVYDQKCDCGDRNLRLSVG